MGISSLADGLESLLEKPRWTLVFYFVAAVISYQLIALGVRSIYNIFLSPLRNLPGPKLGALFEFHRHFFYLKGTAPYHETELHQKYGPVVRTGPHHVNFIDPQAWPDIYGHRTRGRLATVKLKTLQPRYEGHDMLEFVESEEEHGQRRRLYAHAFSDQAIRKQEPMLRGHVEKLLTKLKETDKPQDLVAWMHFVTFDIMGDLAFGHSMGMLDDAKYSPWVYAIVSSMKDFTFVFILSQYQPFKFFMDLFLGRLLHREINKHKQFAAERVDKRLAMDVDRPDIWGLVMKADPDRMPSRWAMHEDGSLFMQGGTDTTSTLLSGLLYHMLKTPGTLNKLQDEVRSACPSFEDMTLEKLARLPYMAACIEEGLRIHPPAPPSFERRVPAGGLAICGQFFAEGTIVGVPQYAAYHSEYNFALPGEFHPERWLAENKDERFAKDRKDALQPFLFGPRNCIGKNLAYNEMRLILAGIVGSFDLELDQRSVDWMPHGSYGLWQKPPLWIRFKSRA